MSRPHGLQGLGVSAPREQARRRAILLGIGLLILLSVGPVFGHHFAHGLERGLAGRDHLGPLCLIALHELLAPVHRLFHLLVVAGLVYACADRLRASGRLRRTLGALDSRAPTEGDEFWKAAGDAGLDPARILIVEGLPVPAFTAGWLRPRIFAARSIALSLSRPELAALLAHEDAHRRRRDPLRLSSLRFLACTLFWIPALRRLADDLADEAEVEADDRAAELDPLALASAILALARWRAVPLPGTTAFAQRVDLLDRRVRRLAGEDTTPASHVTRRSMLGASGALAAVWISGAIMAHPLPPTGGIHRAFHCDHPTEAAISHLFCFPDALWSKSEGCPHARRA